MPSLVDLAASRIAEATAPQGQQTAVKWRWGTVEAVNADGTMDVDIAGSTVPSVTALASATSAAAGDRVRVDYLGTDAVVAGVRATSGPPEREDGTIERNTSNCSSLGTSWLSAKNGVVALSFIDAKLTNALASGSNVVIATLPAGFRPRANRYICCIEKAGLWARITASGEVRISNRTGASYAAGSTVTFSDSY